MESKLEEQLQLLPAAELDRRIARMTGIMRRAGVDAVLIGDNANLFYLTGRVFCGYIYIDANGGVSYLVRRPGHLLGGDVLHIRKIEDIASLIAGRHPDAAVVGLELDALSWTTVSRISAMLGDKVAVANASDIMRRTRAVKTDAEIALMRASGVKQTQVYNAIPHLYQDGMTDIELQIEIERALRLGGCLGQFRTAGQTMELYMGSVLTGDNADAPSPYDFAMGGAGLHPSLPVGANGSIIKPHRPVMIDMNGNFTGYMTDMTRCYVVDSAAAEAVRLNRLSADICAAVADAARPGAKASDLYNIALTMAEAAGAGEWFMGHRYHAGFVGHGVGIEVNELPVLAPRSRDVLEAGNTIAVEPKFVVPGLGAVGIENTYVVCADGPARRITDASEEIISLR
ncbi:MAG: Xaa-Pro peptidase family protein [Bacteroidales bacterium]|nr:Xaa-Pro peptidase family protein [Bacteroidales bacterium]